MYLYINESFIAQDDFKYFIDTYYISIFQSSMVVR